MAGRSYMTGRSPEKRRPQTGANGTCPKCGSDIAANRTTNHDGSVVWAAWCRGCGGKTVVSGNRESAVAILIKYKSRLDERIH
jgi:hypothetical protein